MSKRKQVHPETSENYSQILIR